MDVINIQGKLTVDNDAVVEKTFDKPLFLSEVALLTAVTNSPPLCIPMEAFKFKIDEREFAVDKKYYPTIDDVLANLTKKCAAFEVTFYTDETTTDVGLKRMTIVATMGGRSKPLTVHGDKKFCALFGAAHDEKWGVITSGDGHVIYLQSLPIVPGMMAVYIKDSHLINRGTQTRLRLATLPANVGKSLMFNLAPTALNYYPLGGSFSKLELKFEWVDGKPYLPFNSDITVALAYK